MSYKVAIIEDDLAIQQMYRMKFDTEGFEVQVADNGADGGAGEEGVSFAERGGERGGEDGGGGGDSEWSASQPWLALQPIFCSSEG